jgi:hypothetical protein
MMWVPVILACVTGACEFMAGDVYWSAAKCETVLQAVLQQLVAQEITAMGVCIQVKVA